MRHRNDAFRTVFVLSIALVATFSLGRSNLLAQDAKPDPKPAGEAKAVKNKSPLDTVELKNGSIQRGYVVETGDNAIRLERGGGARRFLKNEILSIKFHKERRAESKLEHDRVELKTGHEVDGKVKVIDGGKRVRVTLAKKRANGKATTVTYPMTTVRRIRWKDESEFAQNGNYYTVELEKQIANALQKLRIVGDKERVKVEAFLASTGVFSIEAIKARAAAKEAAGGLDDEEGMSLLALQHLYELKLVVPTEIQESVPEIYDVLSLRSNAERKIEFLKAILPNYSERAVDLVVHVVKNPLEADSVRGLAVDMMRRLQLNQALLNLYNGAQGQLQFAAAIALSKNRILLGIPTLIEALDLPRESIRKLAADQLRSATGQNFRYQFDGAAAARKLAAGKWSDWWTDNKAEIEKTSILILREGTGQSPEWKMATQLWKEAHKAWGSAPKGKDRGKHVEEAKTLLKEAVDTDPTFVKASISLAVIQYVEDRDPTKAETLLSDLVQRPLSTTSARDRFWIHLEYANVLRIQGKIAEALRNYDECLALDPSSVEATTGRADVLWLLGTGRGKLPPAVTDKEKEKSAGDRRRTYLSRALSGFEDSLKKIEALLEKLVVLRAEDLPEFDTLPFARRLHNRSVLEARRGYEQEIVRIYQRIARVHTLQGQVDQAVTSIRRGLDYLSISIEGGGAEKLEANLRSHLALAYERQGKVVEAYKEYRRVLKVDPENKTGRDGIKRLERKSHGTKAKTRRGTPGTAPASRR
ncbi:MAG: tetratricopeptide repeat protein [Planctomycetota bacterium]